MPTALPIVPPPVRPGDTLAVIRTAGAVDPARVDAGVQLLRDRGYRVKTDAGDRGGPPWLAGTDAERAAALVDAIRDPDVGAIVFARGGSGSNRLFDRLPAGLLAQNPTWLVGLSDITALHLWAQAQGVASIHGPMAARLPDHVAADADPALGPDRSVDALLALLANPVAPTFDGLTAVRAGRASGPLIGGNLSLLAALIGQPLPHGPRGLAPVDLRGAVVFVEEVAEPAYRMDRMLTSLFTGARRDVAAVVVGTCERCAPGVEMVTDRLAELLDGTGMPVLSGVAAGHSMPNAPFVLGLPVDVDASAGRVEPTTARASAGPVVLRTPTTGAEVLAAHVAAGATPGAQLAVAIGGEIVESVAVGRRAGPRYAGADTRPVSAHTRFDLASVTKAVSTAILAMRAIDDGLVSLDDRVPADLSVDRPTLRDLLRHTSGLPAHIEVFREARGADDPLACARSRFAAVRVGPDRVGQATYSDVGYIALGRWLERLFGEPLDARFARHIAEPLGLERTTFGPVDAAASRDGVAATEHCPWRGALLQGIVHDENAQVLGGVCGHAGLFGTAAELARIGTSLLGHGAPVLPAASVDRMWDLADRVDGGTYTLGWDTPSGARSNAGRWMRRGATFGHLGFTGTSLWIDRSRDLVIALVTNRVHPTRDNPRIRSLRPAVHDAVVETWFDLEAP